MAFYRRVIFPWLCELALNQPFLATYRRELLAVVRGEVLEIGFGTGLNLPHYPPAVQKITIVDPNPGMHRKARKRIAVTGIQVQPHVLSSEQLPFAAGTFDFVVSTFTLCSIENVRTALGEIYRVLRPGGRFLFLEHGLSPEAHVQKWQHRLDWLERHLADNCRLTRNMRQLISEQPFQTLDLDEHYLEHSPKTHGYVYRGAAVK